MTNQNTAVTQCAYCGKEIIGQSFYWFAGRPCCDDCHKIKAATSQLQGWICPVCGRGNSPYKSSCDCQPYKVTFTQT